MGLCSPQTLDQSELSLMVSDFFDTMYARYPRYWLERRPYSVSPEDHGSYHACLLQQLSFLEGGRALDLACGEGSDSIRLAGIGMEIDAYDLSEVALLKAETFARRQGITQVKWEQRSATDARIGDGTYDLVMCNGLLHYIVNKRELLERLANLVKPGGLFAASVFSTATKVPGCHQVVPVLPDTERGELERVFNGWQPVLRLYERLKPDRSHPGFPPHVHSFIKLIARRPPLDALGPPAHMADR
jgi:ubiquinone/menaquinone biosynthesis C-methylase UbiE